MALPSFSIVTPNFNGEQFVDATLRSVITQKYPDLEYIVVDGASTDGSLDVIRRYSENISEVISEPDSGHAHALMKGFNRTSGEIMGWINSDDILLPRSLENVAKIFSAFPEIDWITGRPSALHESGRIREFHTRNWSRLRFVCGNYRWVQQESTFWRRSLWERAGGYISQKHPLATDFELWVRFFRFAELHSVDLPLGAFRYRQGQRSAKYQGLYEAEALAIIQTERQKLDAQFEEQYRSLIPSVVAPLSDEEIIELESEISIADPALIGAKSSIWRRGRLSTVSFVTNRAPLGRAVEIEPLVGEVWYSKWAHLLEQRAPRLFRVLQRLYRSLVKLWRAHA